MHSTDRNWLDSPGNLNVLGKRRAL
jgi:hypothetical protein